MAGVGEKGRSVKVKNGRSEDGWMEEEKDV